MEWTAYQDCCQRHAADTSVAHCPECGHPFLRCRAFPQCKGLVEQFGACPACVNPALAIDTGAMPQLRIGDRMSLPLGLRNASTSGRQMRVIKIARRDEGDSEAALNLTWEQIEPGRQRRFSVDTPPLMYGGGYTLRMIFVVAIRYNEQVEEHYAFEGEITVNVSGKDGGHTTTTITITGGTGNYVDSQSLAADAVKVKVLAGDQPLQRSEKYELTHGIRGYQSSQVRIPRNVDTTFNGFRADDVPPADQLAKQGRISVGRNSRNPSAESKATPNDLCVLVVNSRTGEIDGPASMAISRHHFNLVLINDRVCLQVLADGGLSLNTQHVPKEELVTLQPGDSISPFPGHPDKLQLKVSFATTRNPVNRVNLSRTPALK